MKYETLFFDADGTLFDFSAAERKSLSAAMRSVVGRDLAEAELTSYRKINQLVWEQLERGEIDADTLRARRFELFVGETGIPADPATLGESYLGNLEHTVVMFEGAIELLAWCRPRFRMALITNGFSRIQQSKIDISGIGDYFDTITISEEVGYTKPDAAIFEITAGRMGGVRKETTLMIGDSLTSDIQGGINFGIDTCLIRNGSAASAPPTPTCTIDHISELGNLLRN